MRIPPQVLSDPLNALCISPYEGTLAVRTPDLRAVQEDVTWPMAYAMAYRGEIEAVANTSGRLRYFRLLPQGERPAMPECAAQEVFESNSTVIANTKLGVYREAVRAEFFSQTGGPQGEPGIEMRIVGYLWQHWHAHL